MLLIHHQTEQFLVHWLPHHPHMTQSDEFKLTAVPASPPPNTHTPLPMSVLRVQTSRWFKKKKKTTLLKLVFFALL